MYIDNQNVDKYKHKLQFQRGTDWSPDGRGQACSLVATNLEAITVSLFLLFLMGKKSLTLENYCSPKDHRFLPLVRLQTITCFCDCGLLMKGYLSNFPLLHLHTMTHAGVKFYKLTSQTE